MHFIFLQRSSSVSKSSFKVITWGCLLRRSSKNFCTFWTHLMQHEYFGWINYWNDFYAFMSVWMAWQSLNQIKNILSQEKIEFWCEKKYLGKSTALNWLFTASKRDSRRIAKNNYGFLKKDFRNQNSKRVVNITVTFDG